LSWLTVVPQSRDLSHNPRVVIGDRRCCGVTFSETDEVGCGDGWPKVSLRVPHLFAMVCDLGIFFNL
jgi:hypothetical protein